ncbi:RNA polymerase sigma-70 factor [Rhodanobacter glycinis]|uniref:RNA polymerase sigma-70 factor n=1 Tax=Rhodanobacter glycinis TaxID=582702 RepID=A0A502CHL5_9GAMM|nr:RNA polymerase sigma-70 factor [Rhodanobacter glycinis]TPG11256.1 RNA polymerase sigma-70 factor [Rhodanobacter glycinis]
MDAATATFHDLRPRLQGIAYRMLGSISESEDIVQDVWLRWHAVDKDSVNNAEAWLVATTTRISIDRLRSAKARREQYVGIWLPEPVLTEWPATPEDIEELSNEVSVALLTVLERLTPEARAAFLLREVFDVDYGEVAEVLGKSEAACRQIVHRAKAQLRQGRPQRAVPSEVHQKLVRRFADVLAQGDFAGMKSMLADTAVLMGDGGGYVTSFPRPMVGGPRIAQLLFAATLRYKDTLRIELAMINGQYAVLRYIGDELESAQSYESDGERITRVHVQRNPEKLARLVAALTQRPIRRQLEASAPHESL